MIKYRNKKIKFDPEMQKYFEKLKDDLKEKTKKRHSNGTLVKLLIDTHKKSNFKVKKKRGNKSKLVVL